MFMQAEGQIGTINPVFAGYAAQQLCEATGGIDRVFDNLLEIARGNDPDANGYDRLRATRVLYDRGMGKVTKSAPRAPTQGSERPPKSGESGNHTNHSSDNNRPVARLEQKLDEALGPPQAPISLDEPGHVPDTPGYTPDLAREAQYYVLEITNYGAELASILAYIHEPDPEDTSIRPCHRITAGEMILDRVIGAVADLEQPLDHWQDPSLEPNWIKKHPSEIDSAIPLEKIIEADRAAQGAGRPTGAQRIGVVDAVAARQRGSDQRQHLVARVRPPRGIAQVEALLDEFGQAEMPGQGGRKEQPGVGHQSAVVEGDLDPVGVVA